MPPKGELRHESSQLPTEHSLRPKHLDERKGPARNWPAAPRFMAHISLRFIERNVAPRRAIVGTRSKERKTSGVSDPFSHCRILHQIAQQLKERRRLADEEFHGRQKIHHPHCNPFCSSGTNDRTSRKLAGAVDPVTGVSVIFPDLNSPPFGGEDTRYLEILQGRCTAPKSRSPGFQLLLRSGVELHLPECCVLSVPLALTALSHRPAVRYRRSRRLLQSVPSSRTNGDRLRLSLLLHMCSIRHPPLSKVSSPKQIECQRSVKGMSSLAVWLRLKSRQHDTPETLAKPQSVQRSPSAQHCAHTIPSLRPSLRNALVAREPWPAFSATSHLQVASEGLH